MYDVMDILLLSFTCVCVSVRVCVCARAKHPILNAMHDQLDDVQRNNAIHNPNLA